MLIKNLWSLNLFFIKIIIPTPYLEHLVFLRHKTTWLLRVTHLFCSGLGLFACVPLVLSPITREQNLSPTSPRSTPGSFFYELYVLGSLLLWEALGGLLLSGFHWFQPIEMPAGESEVKRTKRSGHFTLLPPPRFGPGLKWLQPLWILFLSHQASCRAPRSHHVPWQAFWA